MMNIKDINPNLLNIDRILFKTTSAVIYDTGYTTINIVNKNPLNLSVNNIVGYIRKSNEDKYLIFASADKKKVLKTL